MGIDEIVQVGLNIFVDYFCVSAFTRFPEFGAIDNFSLRLKMISCMQQQLYLYIEKIVCLV